MKQSTFSAVMANSIKNLLQGYTKSIRFVAVLTVLLTMGIGQVWADVNYKGGYFYFDNSLNVNKGYVMLCGRRHKENGNDNWYTAVTTFNKTSIDGTKLYYTGSLEGSTWNTSTWNGWVVISDASQWGNGKFENWTSAGWCSAYRNDYGFNAGSTYVLRPTSTSKSQSIEVDYHGSYSGLNHDQTVYKHTSTDNGSSYSAKSVNSGTVTISAYKMTGNGAAADTNNKQTINVASTTSKSVSAAYTGEVTVTATANTGYTFVGWFESTSATTAVSTSASYTYNAPNSTKSIYARFKAVQSAVTLNANGGTGGTASVTATYGQAMPKVTDLPTREGYTFNGYFDAASGGTQYYKADGTSARTWNKTDNTTLYAQWTGKTYTVTLDNQGATTAGATSVTATYNAAMPSIANNLPKKTGHAFKGYFTATSGGTKYYNADGTSAKNWDKTDATTLYAQWTINTYSVKWVVDGVELTGAQLDGITTIVNHGEKITTAPKVVVEDYCGDIFVGWTDAVGGEYVHGTSNLYTTEFPTITNDITLYAVFADYKK